MNAETIIYPRLQHIGLTTTNLDIMIDWYGKVLGMTVNHRTAPPQSGQERRPFSAAFLSNDEVHHRIAMFELPGIAVDPDSRHHARVQHIAFEYGSLDDLLGSYVRLKGLGVNPVMAADEGIQTVIYYRDPDGNAVELNVNNYADDKAATEYMRSAAADRPTRMFFDPETMLVARRQGASAWELHERAMAGELAPVTPVDARAML